MPLSPTMLIAQPPFPAERKTNQYCCPWNTVEVNDNDWNPTPVTEVVSNAVAVGSPLESPCRETLYVEDIA
jgi:hypothetical protein